MREHSIPDVSPRFQQSILDAIDLLRSLRGQNRNLTPEGDFTANERILMLKILQELREPRPKNSEKVYTKIEKLLNSDAAKRDEFLPLKKALLKILEAGITHIPKTFVAPPTIEKTHIPETKESVLKKALTAIVIHASTTGFTRTEIIRLHQLEKTIKQLNGENEEKKIEELKHYFSTYTTDRKSEAFEQFLNKLGTTLEIFPLPQPKPSLKRLDAGPPPPPDPETPVEIPPTVDQTSSDFTYGAGGAADLPRVAAEVTVNHLNRAPAPPDLPVAPDLNLNTAHFKSTGLPSDESHYLLDDPQAHPIDEEDDEPVDPFDIQATQPFMKKVTVHKTTAPIPEFVGDTSAPGPIPPPETIEIAPTPADSAQTLENRFKTMTQEELRRAGDKEFNNFTFDDLNEDEIPAPRLPENNNKTIEFTTRNDSHGKYVGPVDENGDYHTEKKDGYTKKGRMEITVPVAHPEGPIVPRHAYWVEAAFQHGVLIPPASVGYNNEHGTLITVEGPVDENYLPHGECEAHNNGESLLFQGNFEHGVPTHGRTFRSTMREIKSGDKKGQEETQYQPLHTEAHFVDIDLLPTNDDGEPISVHPHPSRRLTGSLTAEELLDPVLVARGRELFKQPTVPDASLDTSSGSDEILDSTVDLNPASLWGAEGPTMVGNIQDIEDSTNEAQPTAETALELPSLLEATTQLTKVIDLALDDLPENTEDTYRTYERQMISDCRAIVQESHHNTASLLSNVEDYLVQIDTYLNGEAKVLRGNFSERFFDFLKHIQEQIQDIRIQKSRKPIPTDKLFAISPPETEAEPLDDTLNGFDQRWEEPTPPVPEAQETFKGIRHEIADLVHDTEIANAQEKNPQAKLNRSERLLLDEIGDILDEATYNEQEVIEEVDLIIKSHPTEFASVTFLEFYSAIKNFLQSQKEKNAPEDTVIPEPPPEPEPDLSPEPEVSSEVKRLRTEINDLMSDIQNRAKADGRPLTLRESDAFQRLNSGMKKDKNTDETITTIRDLIGAVYLEQLSFPSEIPIPWSPFFYEFSNSLEKIIEEWQEKIRAPLQVKKTSEPLPTATAAESGLFEPPTTDDIPDPEADPFTPPTPEPTSVPQAEQTPRDEKKERLSKRLAEPLKEYTFFFLKKGAGHPTHIIDFGLCNQALEIIGNAKNYGELYTNMAQWCNTISNERGTHSRAFVNCFKEIKNILRIFLGSAIEPVQEDKSHQTVDTPDKPDRRIATMPNIIVDQEALGLVRREPSSETEMSPEFLAQIKNLEKNILALLKKIKGAGSGEKLFQSFPDGFFTTLFPKDVPINRNNLITGITNARYFLENQLQPHKVGRNELYWAFEEKPPLFPALRGAETRRKEELRKQILDDPRAQAWYALDIVLSNLRELFPQ